MVKSSARCRRTERAISWNRRGRYFKPSGSDTDVQVDDRISTGPRSGWRINAFNFNDTDTLGFAVRAYCVPRGA